MIYDHIKNIGLYKGLAPGGICAPVKKVVMKVPVA